MIILNQKRNGWAVMIEHPSDKWSQAPIFWSVTNNDWVSDVLRAYLFVTQKEAEAYITKLRDDLYTKIETVKVDFSIVVEKTIEEECQTR